MSPTATTDPRIRLGTARLAEVSEGELTRAEGHLLEGVSSPERRAELAGGRVAARRALPGIEVLADAGGAPVLCKAPPGWSVSITHAAGVAVAAVGPFARLGIDLVPPSDEVRLARLVPRILAAEAGQLRSLRDRLACWALKEAALKATRSGLDALLSGDGPRVLSLEPPRLDVAGLSAELGEIPEGILALVWGA
jgi:4'-phosphopantetheinyl transferase EntD